MTLFLDPKSQRIAKATGAEKAQAKVWFEKRNPFVATGAPPLQARLDH